VIRHAMHPLWLQMRDLFLRSRAIALRADQLKVIALICPCHALLARALSPRRALVRSAVPVLRRACRAFDL